MDKKLRADELVGLLKTNGGFTATVDAGIGLAARYSPVNGAGKFAVSLKGRERKVGELLDSIESELRATQAVIKFAWDNIATLSTPGHLFGAWVDEGQIYLDISVLVDSRAEANRLARENEQIAYWDFDKGEAVLPKEEL